MNNFIRKTIRNIKRFWLHVKMDVGYLGKTVQIKVIRDPHVVDKPASILIYGQEEEVKETIQNRHPSSFDDPLTILGVTIRYRGMVFMIYQPYRHHHVIYEMARLGFDSSCMVDQGFMTCRGHHVDRCSSAVIAASAGQIKKKTGPNHILFSEDLW